jgi:hypothetical protein
MDYLLVLSFVLGCILGALLYGNYRGVRATTGQGREAGLMNLYR